MKWSIGRRLALGFALPLLVLLAVGLVSYRTLESGVATARWWTTAPGAVRPGRPAGGGGHLRREAPGLPGDGRRRRYRRL